VSLCRLPTSGLLTCEFVSKRLKRDVVVLDVKKFGSLLSQLKKSTISDKGRLELVSLFVSHAFFKCSQVSDIQVTLCLQCHTQLRLKAAASSGSTDRQIIHSVG
jgi:hypothetical protein